MEPVAGDDLRGDALDGLVTVAPSTPRGLTPNRIGLAIALLISALVPAVALASEWTILTKPFWYNEQWRAYYISDPHHWWAALRSDGAPFPAGWFFLEKAAGYLFGSTELSLRLPTALFLPIASVLLFLLARRWIPSPGAVIVALLGSMTGALTSYAVQLSEYQIDAAAAVAVILLHQLVMEGSERSTRRRIYRSYAGISVACVFSTPALFVAAPLLLLDVSRSVRRRSLGPSTIPALLAGIVILIHLGVFVLRQNALTKSPYWDPSFLPHRGLGRQLAFVWHGLTGFVTQGFTGYFGGSRFLLLAHSQAWPLTTAFILFLVIGIWSLRSSQQGRAILLATGGSLVLTLIASYLQRWPFGFVRTNFYLLPVLIFIAGVGGARSVALFVTAVQSIRRHRIGSVTSVGAASAAIGLTALLVTGSIFAGGYEIEAFQRTADSGAPLNFEERIPSAVAAVRALAAGDDVLVVAGYMSIPGWEYYQFEYAGRSTRTGPPLVPGHVVLALDHGSPAITRAVEEFQPRHVFIYVPLGTTREGLFSDIRAADAAERCGTTASSSFEFSGLLLQMKCQPEGVHS